MEFDPEELDLLREGVRYLIEHGSKWGASPGVPIYKDENGETVALYRRERVLKRVCEKLGMRPAGVE